jgi:hypothetical protein
VRTGPVGHGAGQRVSKLPEVQREAEPGGKVRCFHFKPTKLPALRTLLLKDVARDRRDPLAFRGGLLGPDFNDGTGPGRTSNQCNCHAELFELLS